MSWIPQVIADDSGIWAGNGLRFETREEALERARALMARWTLVSDYRAVESDDPPNHRLVNGELEPIR
jgi:hypothetical protein